MNRVYKGQHGLLHVLFGNYPVEADGPKNPAVRRDSTRPDRTGTTPGNTPQRP